MAEGQAGPRDRTRPNRLAAGVRERVEVVQRSDTDRDVVDKAFDCADSVFWLVPPDPQAARVEAAYVDLAGQRARR